MGKCEVIFARALSYLYHLPGHLSQQKTEAIFKNLLLMFVSVPTAVVRFFLEIQIPLNYTAQVSLTLNGECLAVMFGSSFWE